MAVFVHLFDAKNRAAIARGGIRQSRCNVNGVRRGVYATPQLADHLVTHQWMRELRRVDGRVVLAVRFRIPDDELVYIGKYNEDHLEVTASRAIDTARAHEDPLGLEVVIPRSIDRREIVKVYKPPKVAGWRYYPASRGRRPCGCPYCQRGQPYGRRIRRRYEEDA